MSAIILIGVTGIIVLLLGIAVAWRVKKQRKRHEPDYKAFFWMGLVWMIIGAPFMFIYRFTFNALFAIGVIFFIMGAANRNKWKGARPLNQEQKTLLFIGVVIAVAAVALLYFFFP